MREIIPPSGISETLASLTFAISILLMDSSNVVFAL
jgi:hypothetical protein